MNNLSLLSDALDDAQYLKELHYFIEEHKLPIISKDDLDEQIIAIEQYLGQDHFIQLHAKRKKANIGTGILALPVLFYCIFLFMSRYMGFFNVDLNTATISQMIFADAIKYIWLVIAYALGFIALIAYFYKLNAQAKQQMHQVTQQLVKRTQS